MRGRGWEELNYSEFILEQTITFLLISFSSLISLINLNAVLKASWTSTAHHWIPPRRLVKKPSGSGRTMKAQLSWLFQWPQPTAGLSIPDAKLPRWLVTHSRHKAKPSRRKLEDPPCQPRWPPPTELWAPLSNELFSASEFWSICYTSRANW